MDILKYFKKGLRGTVLVQGSHFSYGGSWKSVETSLPLDRWYQGDFASAEYTISIELGRDKKEIIKCIIKMLTNQRGSLIHITPSIFNTFIYFTH